MSLTGRTWTTTGALLLVTLLAATACDSTSSTADGASKSPTPAPSTTLSALTPPPSSPESATPTPPARHGQLLKLVVSGGFAGLHNELVVKADGSYTSTSRDGKTTTGTLPPDALAKLRTALKDADFAHLPPRPTGRPIADALMYQFTYEGHVVLTDDIHQGPALRNVRTHLPVGYR
ncbi:hypothetical protein [Streptomyces sp. BPTC-684]|uniref:hypothetical protein n=1 Tax=Streptomyces sp. BPTC-684 TaxID=3043734 RepID=UPI0024B223FB|nr:hypothetical protein [Streptomyces sp. BPTC-684]WHM36670.1 hypothetical protein QIY60_06765 [Streptomyces sp. BPTC-684]